MECRTLIVWEELFENPLSQMVYKRIDEDGLVRVTAIKGYAELDEYLASLEATKQETE
jgi:hypothetical protein